MRSNRIKAALFLVCCMWASSGYAVTLRQLTAPPVISDIKISPTGDYLALKIFQDGKHHIQFMARETLVQLGGISFPGRNEVGDYFWVNDERVVVMILEASGSEEAPIYFGELFAANYDGSKSDLIFGYRAGQRQVGSHIRKKDADFAWADIIDVLPDDKRRILISKTSMSRARNRTPEAIMLDSYSGVEKRKIKTSPYPKGRFYTDIDGSVRLVSSRKPDGSLHLHTLPDGAKKWIDIPESKYGEYFTPIAITDDKKSVHVLDNIDNDKVGLHKLSLDGENYRSIYSHKNVDITNLVMSTDGRSVNAIRIDDGYPSYLVFSNRGEEGTTLKALLQTFSGESISIRSRSRDGRYWIVWTSTDVDPGSYYLFDSELNTLSKLFDSRPQVKSDDLAAIEAIEFQSFDDRTIAGYFTPAKGSSGEIAPLVVLVHGGPGIRDYWGYDAEVQALATNGFSVLQINFRGSKGYGKAFEVAGYRQWGNEIQKDIIAGTQWAIEQQRATAGNICIMGGSFGAYSAVQSAILAPDLFTCVVANAGIYDLSLLYKKGDVAYLYLGESELEKLIGRDKDELDRFSPVNGIANLRAPIFIAHGKRDQRAPFEHAQRLKKALDKHDKDYEWFVKRREAHGFYNNDNQVEYLQAVIAYLSKHLSKNAAR